MIATKITRRAALVALAAVTSLFRRSKAAPAKPEVPVEPGPHSFPALAKELAEEYTRYMRDKTILNEKFVARVNEIIHNFVVGYCAVPIEPEEEIYAEAVRLNIQHGTRHTDQAWTPHYVIDIDDEFAATKFGKDIASCVRDLMSHVHRTRETAKITAIAPIQIHLKREAYLLELFCWTTVLIAPA